MRPMLENFAQPFIPAPGRFCSEMPICVLKTIAAKHAALQMRFPEA